MKNIDAEEGRTEEKEIDRARKQCFEKIERRLQKAKTKKNRKGEKVTREKELVALENDHSLLKKKLGMRLPLLLSLCCFIGNNYYTSNRLCDSMCLHYLSVSV